MSELGLAGNLINEDWNLSDEGHLQIVFVDNNNKQWEIEVTGPTDKWTWQYSADPDKRDHTDHNNTQGYGKFGEYAYTKIFDGPAAESAWAILKQVHKEFGEEGSNIKYFPLFQNSNSYAHTLLSTIGVDIAKYLEAATPDYVRSFPGVETDVLADVLNAVSLDLKGTETGDIAHTGVLSDTLTGLGGDDVLSGDEGNDKLDGGDGNDKLYGGPDKDTLSGGWGFDILDGGEGEDTADYSFYVLSDGLKVDLGTGEVSFRPEHSYGSPPLFEKLVSIENVIGGGGKDTLIGSAGNNALSGGPDADIFVLSGGNDVIKDFEPGLGDVIRVPQGIDIQALRSSVTADINNNTVLTHPEGTVIIGSWGPLTADFWFEVA